MTTTHPPTPTSDQRIERHPSESDGYVDANHNLGCTISVSVSVPQLGTTYFEAVTRGLHPSTVRALGRKLLALADECDPPATAAVARRSPEGAERDATADAGVDQEGSTASTTDPAPESGAPVCDLCGGAGVVVAPGIPGITNTRPMTCRCRIAPRTITTVTNP